MRAIDVTERRFRLARRHRLAPGAMDLDVVGLAGALVGLHATDPATVYLSAWARIPSFSVEELEAALYDERSLVKHMAMRRTLFVLPTRLVPIVQGACSDTIARTQRSRLVKDVEQGGVAADGKRWLRAAERATLDALAELGEATGAELSRATPTLQAKLTYGEGKKWGGSVGVATRVLVILEAEGKIVRGRPTGSWTSSQHRWRVADSVTSSLPQGEAEAELVRRWLATFGPGLIGDIVWWTGLGVGKVRGALEAVGAAEVDLDGEVGMILPDDLELTPPVEPWAALLPSLDPTVMGWKQRGWYLGEYQSALFDTSGNAGSTVWWNGRIVGGWSQRKTGEIVYRLLEDVGAEAETAIQQQAARLQAWMGEIVVSRRFPTPLDYELRS